MAGKKGGNTVSKVREIALPLAEELGLEIWDVRFQKEGAEWYLRVFIDKDGCVGIDDCVSMSHALDAPLDEGDFISQSYTLEVCSPGVERELVRKEHFEKSVGKKIMFRLIRPYEGKRDFKGILESFDGENLTADCGDELKICVSKKETAWVRLDDFGGTE